MSAGYSGTPLHRKLGLKPGMLVHIVDAPGPYEDFFAEFPPDIQIAEYEEAAGIDFVHVFCTQFDQLQNLIPSLIPALNKTGMMWISWPKGSSTIPTDINRDSLRSYVIKQGLVDVKVCAIDADWSGLKFVHRIKDR